MRIHLLLLLLFRFFLGNSTDLLPNLNLAFYRLLLFLELEAFMLCQVHLLLLDLRLVRHVLNSIFIAVSGGIDRALLVLVKFGGARSILIVSGVVVV